MYTYTLISTTEFKIENKAKNFSINYMGDETLAISETARFNLLVLNENQTAKLAKLNGYINDQKKAFEAPYSQVSIESFTQKKNEALAWKIDNLAVTPYIDMLCTDSIGTLNTTARDTLIQAILVKVQGIAQLEAFEDATRTAIKATTTQAELDAVVIP